ncbi:MAG: hypothetical protein KC766_36855, partial [Myxococcales bacterium]|nr:hypothetical protein [Myxococcales bacterium]
PTPHNIPGLKPFDYNCDGVEEREFTQAYSSVTGDCRSGWDAIGIFEVPGCGKQMAWRCYVELAPGECTRWFNCDSPATQSCR